MKRNPKTKEQLLAENEDLRRHLEEAEETLRAIHEGEVDALVLSKPEGEVVFTLKGAEHPYRVFVEAMNEGAATLDPEGTILYGNSRFAEMLKLPIEKVIGSSVYRFIPSADEAGFESAFQGGKEQDTTVDISLKKEDQELIAVHLSFNRLPGQDMPVVCLVAMDLTEHKRLEEALRQLNADLEKRVQDRTAELVKVNETLQTEIVERQQTQEALKESGQRWSTTLASIGDAVIATELDGRISFMNAVAEGLTGWTLSEASQKPVKQVFKIINEHTRLAVEDPISKVLETGMIAGLANHTLLIRKDGTEVAIDDSGAPIRDETGKITGVVLVFRDISERRQTEEALRQSHSSLSGINQILHAGLTRQTEAELGRVCLEIAKKITQSRFGFISEINKDGCGSIAISNPGWEACNIFDAGSHRVTGGSFKIHGIYGRVMSDGKPLLTNEPANHPDRVGLPAGHPPLESFLGVPLIREGRTIGMIAVANRPGGYTPAEQKTLEALEPAIVEAFVRKRMEEEIRTSEERFRIALQGSSINVSNQDLDLHYTWIYNPELGYSVADVEGKTDAELLPAEAVGHLTPIKRRVLETGITENTEISFPWSNQLLSFDFTISPLRDRAEKIIGITNVVVNVTDRKQMEEELRKSRDELEMRVQERTAQLEFLNQALKAENEERLKVEIELRESEIRLRQLSVELLHTQERERRLFAQDLHDSIGSSLAAIKFKVEAALSQTGDPGLQPEAEAALKSVIPAIQTAIHETRRIQKALRPPVLDDLGILATIRWFCREYESTYSAIRIKQEIDIEEEEVADSLKIIIFRVLQEALNNIAKHSGAELARLSLRKVQGRIELVLEDDGQGFDLKKVLGSESTRRGFGLTSMSERTELSGGSFFIDSVMGKGTVIRAVWPV